MSKSTFLICLLTSVTICLGFAFGERGTADSTKKDANYYGLIIGVGNYADGSFPTQENSISSAEDLYTTLTTSYNFKTENTKLLTDAKKADLIMSLNELSKVMTSEDQLLIFFTGHGLWDDQEKIGYWLPADATKSTGENWFPNSALVDHLKKINSKHTLVIVDSPFSGSIIATNTLLVNNKSASSEPYMGSSNRAMTSCTLTESSNDGVFFDYLHQSLRKNKEKKLSSEQLLSSFREAYISECNSDPQLCPIPQLAAIGGLNDNDGGFFFLKSR